MLKLLNERRLMFDFSSLALCLIALSSFSYRRANRQTSRPETGSQFDWSLEGARDKSSSWIFLSLSSRVDISRKASPGLAVASSGGGDAIVTGFERMASGRRRSRASELKSPELRAVERMIRACLLYWIIQLSCAILAMLTICRWRRCQWKADWCPPTPFLSAVRLPVKLPSSNLLCRDNRCRQRPKSGSTNIWANQDDVVGGKTTAHRYRVGKSNEACVRYI